jgi:hypothetical protein
MLRITPHSAGFFSCCAVKLCRIIDFYKTNKSLPQEVDGSGQFNKYKNNNMVDITFDFFEHYNNICIYLDIDKDANIINWDEQFVNFKKVDYKSIAPFVKKYFTPSVTIKNIFNNLLLKYDINTDNCVGLYYRGTDKHSETKIDSFDSYYNKLTEIINKESNLKILLQTDSTQFLEYMKNKNLDNIIIIKENSTSCTNYGIHNETPPYQNYINMHNLFATFLIISKCKYIICSSSNCSIWMMYYRENATNVYQNLNTDWL